VLSFTLSFYDKRSASGLITFLMGHPVVYTELWSLQFSLLVYITLHCWCCATKHCCARLFVWRCGVEMCHDYCCNCAFYACAKSANAASAQMVWQCVSALSI